VRKEAMLYDAADDGSVNCRLCAHRCRIADTKFGVCGVRQNLCGKLYTEAYGEVMAAHVDPIEKKPLYHYLPGTTSYSIAAAGCNFRCGFCQNWQISQLSRKENNSYRGEKLSPEEIVRRARDFGCASVSYTYTEPTIFFEYAYDTARLVRAAGLGNVFVTNGYMTEEAARTIGPFLDAANIDLKGFSGEFYKKMCGATLQPVLDTIRLMKEMNIWIELTTLVIPELNDSDEELDMIAEFIASVGKDIPWHLSRFHPDYKLSDRPPTPVSTMLRASGIGERHGLEHVYLGNMPGKRTFAAEARLPGAVRRGNTKKKLIDHGSTETRNGNLA
jgi:pyruvate formate lyase activating enzyme